MDPNRYMPRTLRDRSDYGLKIAKRGYDVQFASDNQLLYNSSFPVLQIVEYLTDDTTWEIVESGSYTYWNDFNGTTSTRWTHKMRRIHGLGHPPMVVPLIAEAWVTNNSDITWNSKYVYYEKDFFTQVDYDAYVAAGAPTGNFVIFNVDIETDVEYPYVDDGIDTEWGQQYDYGIKHILTDDPNTKDPADLGLNANIQSLLVVAVKVATSDTKDLNIYIPAGIDSDKLAPFCFIKSSSDGRWRTGGVSAQAVSGYRPAMPASGINYFTLDGQLVGDKCTLVVVRSPMISSDKYTYSFNM